MRIPNDFNYEGARELFFNPIVEAPEEYKFEWK